MIIKDETKVQNEICLGKGNLISVETREKIVTCKMNKKKSRIIKRLLQNDSEV